LGVLRYSLICKTITSSTHLLSKSNYFVPKAQGMPA
jgi:hypothetical protein